MCGVLAPVVVPCGMPGFGTRILFSEVSGGNKVWDLWVQAIHAVRYACDQVGCGFGGGRYLGREGGGCSPRLPERG